MPKRKLKWVHLESGAILDDDIFQKYIEAFDMPPYVQTPTKGRTRIVEGANEVGRGE